MRDADAMGNLVLELETLKEMRIDMDRCLEMMQFIRKDLETMAENLETLEALNKDWCHLQKKRRIKNKETDVQKQ
ncbi:hypothetical protein B7P43_G11864 [Cryptotermes secundus]|uniref:Uncharacterized protein n=1 Tax=Cryptotermes secundus TaxID=105785 RepID=A0A2J7QKP6_9NEOP|nr:hypothetical protein B7P43_G11864 [Cryptotermes secundus]